MKTIYLSNKGTRYIIKYRPVGPLDYRATVTKRTAFASRTTRVNIHRVNSIIESLEQRGFKVGGL